jgi:hypothetical protein
VFSHTTIGSRYLDKIEKTFCRYFFGIFLALFVDILNEGSLAKFNEMELSFIFFIVLILLELSVQNNENRWNKMS